MFRLKVHSRWCYVGGGGMDGSSTDYSGADDFSGGWGGGGGSGVNDPRGMDYYYAVDSSGTGSTGSTGSTAGS